MTAPARISNVLAVVVLLAVPAPAQDIEAKLEKHAFFSKIDYTRVDTYPPFVFFMQRPPKDDASYADRVIKRYLPYLNELERLFMADYVKPLGLERRSEVGTYSIAILASTGSYTNYSNAVRDPGLNISRAHFDPDLQLAVTYEDPFARQRNREKRNALLHEFVHALQFAYYSGAGPMPRPIWFNEGLADYRASARNLVSSLKSPDIVAHHVRMVGSLMANAKWRPMLCGLEQLVATDGPGYVSVVVNARKRFGRNAAAPDADFDNLAIAAFYGQANMMVHFLHHGAGGKYRAGFLEYAKAVMSGKNGFEPFETAFAALGGVAAVESAFTEFVRDETKKRAPGIAKRIVVPGSGPAAAGSADASAPVPVFDAARLAPKPEQWRAQLGAVIDHAAQSEYEEALALAASLAAPDASSKERVVREKARVERLLAFRDGFLAAMQKGQKLVQIEGGGKNRRGKIESVANGVIRLKFGRLVHEIALNELTPMILYREAKKRKQFAAAADWLGGYLLLLAGRPISEQDKHLRGSEPAAALRRDRADYPELMAQGSAARGLWRLARLPAIENREQAVDALATLRSVLGEVGSSPLVTSRRSEVEALGRYLLDVSFDASSPESLGVAGTIEPAGSGRVRISYDFEAPAEAADFVPTDDYLKDLRNAFGPVSAPRKSGFRVDDGVFEGIGEACYRFRLPIRAPFKVQYTVTFSGEGFFFSGACADGLGDGVLCDTVGSLNVDDAASNIHGQVESKLKGIYVGRTYRFELAHDGNGTVTSRVNDNPAATADRIGDLAGGWVTFWIHSNHAARIDKFVIEGTIDEGRIGAVKSAWIEAELAKLFR